MSFDMRTIRIRINNGFMTTDCTRPGCGWDMTFSPMIRLAQITEACAAHPCKSELIDELRTIADMTPNEGMQLLRLTLARYDG